jgi:hypothetical protein
MPLVLPRIPASGEHLAASGEHLEIMLGTAAIAMR